MATSKAPPGAAPPSPRGGAWHALRSALGIGSAADWAFKLVCQSTAVLVLLFVGLIVALLSVQAWPAVRTLGTSLLTGRDWAPNLDRFGGLPFLYGSVVTSALAMLLAVPLGVGTAAFLAEIAPGWVRRGGSFLVELLAAIPSVVYGFWGVNFLAPNVQRVFDLMGGPNVGGKGLLSAGLILAVMVVPYITAVSYDVCRAVPRAQREGSLALGATHWQTIWGVVLPYARPGIIGGCFLGLGRAIGETMAVTMLIGNTPVIELLPFGRGDSIPSVIANQLPAAETRLHGGALIGLGLLLFGITILMNVTARLLIWRVGRPRKSPTLWSRLTGGAAAAAAPAPAPRAPAKTRRAAAVNRLMTGGSGYEPQAGVVALAVLCVLAAAVGLWVEDPGLRGALLTGLAAAGAAVVVATLGVLGLCLAVTCVPLFLILGYITYRGAGGVNLAFFTQLPTQQGDPRHGGLANALVGSGMLVGLATLFAVPVGLLAAIFLAEYRANRLAPAVRFVGELLAGVPSIVVGTFVYALVRIVIEAGALSPKEQFSGWAGAVALAIMMVPVVMRASEESLRLVPQALRNASHALGAHYWQTVLRVSVPAALPAIITGVFLAIARIAGETAPLLMTAFGNETWPEGPSDQTPALPLYIFRYSMSGYKPWEDQAWAAALVLLAFVMLLNVGIRILTGKRVVLASRAD
jgi:phosphate transport system permease protein